MASNNEPGLAPPEAPELGIAASLLDAIGDAVIATDVSGKIIFWNRAAERVYGWTAREVLGRGILDVTPSTQSRSTAAAIMAILGKGETWSGQFETRAKDGRTFAISVTDYPVRNADGALTAIVGISRPLPALPATAATPAASTREPQRIVRERGASSPFGVASSQLIPGFAIAVALYGVAIVTRLGLDQFLPDRLPFITFFPVLALAALVCGLWPTVALLVALAITGTFWVSPLGLNPTVFWAISSGLFVLSGAVLIAIVVRLADAQRRVERQEEEHILLVQELRHRLKNLLAIVSSVGQQTVRSALPREALAAALSGRIQAIAAAQDVLNLEAARGTELGSLVEAIVRPLAPGPTRLVAAGPTVLLPADAVTSLALVLHELATNAVKYGAWSAGGGAGVSIAWNLDPQNVLTIVWHEAQPVATPPTREGFGSTLIKRAVNGANVRLDIGTAGVDCRIELRL